MKTTKILVPVDFSEHSRKALEYAAFLGRALNGSLKLLHVWTPPTSVAPDLMFAVPGWSVISLEQHARAEAGKEFEKFVSAFNKEGLSVESGIEVGRPGAAILRAAANDAVDLIVMGTHGRTGLGRLFLGSVAQEVVAKASCPVVTVRAAEAKE